jgi:hypothetical protein
MRRLVGMDHVPDPCSLASEQLKLLLKKLVSREQEVSDTRQVLHAQIDALRRELVNRLRDEGGEVIFGPDMLGPGTSGVREPRPSRPQRGSDGVALPRPLDTDVGPDMRPPEDPARG